MVVEEVKPAEKPVDREKVGFVFELIATKIISHFWVFHNYTRSKLT